MMFSIPSESVSLLEVMKCRDDIRIETPPRGDELSSRAPILISSPRGDEMSCEARDTPTNTSERRRVGNHTCCSTPEPAGTVQRTGTGTAEGYDFFEFPGNPFAADARVILSRSGYRATRRKFCVWEMKVASLDQHGFLV